jgi:hypothetical protein
MTVAPLLGVALRGILGEIEALVFSCQERGPSFYQDLFRPSLPSVLEHVRPRSAAGSSKRGDYALR